MFKAKSYAGHKLCWPGDLVINSLWAWNGGLGVSQHHGIVSTAYGVYRARNSTEVNPHYLHDLLRSSAFQWELQVRSKGVWISRLQLTDTAFLDAAIPMPPPVEQEAIARFLAWATNRLDRAIIDYVKKHYNLAIGDKTAEDVKIKIGAAVPLNEELTMAVRGSDLVSGLPRTVEISTNDIVQAMSRELREMTQAVRKVLQDTPPELAADIIDNGIILTGGSSQLRQMPELIYRRTGVVSKLASDPYYCVVHGTGIALKHLNTYQKSILAKQ